jgi:chromosome partitioning protein
MPARVITVANQKGGVGKTTSVVSLGAELAERFRVLILDLDPQSNATSSLGVDRHSLDASTYDVLIGSRGFGDIIRPTGLPNLAIAPANEDLAGAQIELVDMHRREHRLALALEAMERAEADHVYDIVLIDTPPSLGLLTINALVASSHVLVPVQCEYLALEGLTQLLDTIGRVRDALNPALRLLGILLTMHDPRTNISAQVVNDVRQHFPKQTFHTLISRSVRLAEAPSHGQPIRRYDPSSRGAQAYRLCAIELALRLAHDAPSLA